MKRAAVSLLFVAGCRFDLPGGAADAPIDRHDARAVADASSDGPPTTCPANYTPLTGGNSNHVYKKAPSDLMWTEQDDYCKTTSTRAYLAVPDNAAELTALQGLATGVFWIGINDRVTEGTYVKSNGGTATFLPWVTGQPDNLGNQDCIVATDTTIRDDDCFNAVRSAACECEP